MRARTVIWLSCGAACAVFAGLTCASESHPDLQSLAKRARPSVVRIEIYDSEGALAGSGTGFAVSSDGKLVTNHHVIQSASRATARTEAEEVFEITEVLGDDPYNDVAVLKCEAKGLSPLALGSSENVQPGLWIAVIGYPLGSTLEGSATVSDGILSAVREDPPGRRLLQVTAPISPGSSGSPVLNEQGEVLGVVVSTSNRERSQAINFAVPVEAAKALLTAPEEGEALAVASTRNQASGDRIYSDPDMWAAISARSSNDRSVLDKSTQKLVSSYPDHYVAHFYRGLACGDAGRWPDAVSALQRAVELKPDFVEGWYALQAALSKHGDKTAANEARLRWEQLKRASR